MSGEIEAAGDALTGGIIAGAVEREGNAAGKAAHVGHGACTNCGATLTGPYCAQCGQAAHIHRSLGSLGHDILHGVFHFEGKIWRTLPELAFHPGRLTRRYIDGERAKFVSPMALFLFTVFLTFAVFGFTGGALIGGDYGNGPQTIMVDGKPVVVSGWQSSLANDVEERQEQIDTLKEQRAKPDIDATEKAEIDRKIAARTDDRDAAIALATGNWAKLSEIEARSGKRDGKAASPEFFEGSTGFAPLDRAFKHANENPKLLIYKMKTNGYKYSWMLIPLSIPFMWIMYFWRRDVHLYDHAIFVTYSISFMLLLMILLSIASALGVGAGIWGFALLAIPPIHLYRQLRGAYGSSRAGALLRLFVLMISTTIVISLFAVILVALGVME